MPTETQSLAALLAEIKQKAGWNPQRANTNVAIANIEQVSMFVGFKVRVVKSVARGPDYFIAYPGQLLNPEFITDLTNWTEAELSAFAINFPATFPLIWSGTGITSARVNAKDTYDIAHLSQAALEIKVSDNNTYTGELSRYQVVTAAAAEVWSFEIRCLPTLLTNAKQIVRVEWLDSGDVVLATVTEDVAITSSSTWTENTSALHNLTAPANTAKFKLSLALSLTAGTGRIYFDNCYAIKHTTIRAWSDRGIIGYSKIIA